MHILTGPSYVLS